MINKSNNFKLSITQGNVVLFERIEDANNFTFKTRENYLDIRKILPDAIVLLQKILSKNSYNTKFKVDGNNKYYDFLSEYLKDIDTFPLNVRNELEYAPEPVSFKVNATTPNGVKVININGVECKIAFYNNNKLIVERLFYVDRFNPVSRWSVDLLTTCELISFTIFKLIKYIDIANIWDEYDNSVDLDII